MKSVTQPVSASPIRIPISQPGFRTGSDSEIELTPEFRDIYRHKVAAFSRICSPATVPTLPESSLGGE